MEVYEELGVRRAEQLSTSLEFEQLEPLTRIEYSSLAPGGIDWNMLLSLVTKCPGLSIFRGIFRNTIFSNTSYILKDILEIILTILPLHNKRSEKNS